jgi:hypothetical protein
MTCSCRTTNKFRNLNKNISSKTFSGKFLNHSNFTNFRAIDFSRINIRLLTKQGALKYETDCAPNNGYYFVPVYEKGEYRLQVGGSIHTLAFKKFVSAFSICY